MVTDRAYGNCNKVKTKQELLELLNGYRGILTNPTLNYLNSLIELEFSVMREYISDSDRRALAELEVYKKIAIYNIYNRTQNLFNQQNGEFIIYGNNDGHEGLSISTNLIEKNIKLFDFDYKEVYSKGFNTNRIPDGYKTMNIGDISLYQTLESKEMREAELDRVMNILDRLWSEKNPYSSRPGVAGGPGPHWSYKHEQKVAEYEKRFTELDSKKELSDDDKREIEITNQVRNMLLEDFGLTNESFEEENNKSMINSSQKSKLQKTLVKKMPNLTITDNIKYI